MIGLLSATKDVRFTFYRAKVVDNKDPDKYGRVKVIVPEFGMTKEDDETWLWAYPANVPFGGGNTDIQDQGIRWSGSMIVPQPGQWVWVFAENDNINRLYYIGALYIKNQEVPPETAQGSQWYNKWLLFRSPDGRSIWISDDPDDARTFLTGKKRIKDPKGSVLPIKGNQSVFLIDESNQERILVADYEGNYFLIQTDQSKAYWYTSNAKGTAQCNIFTNQTLVVLDDSGYIKIQVPSATIEVNNGKINITANAVINLKSSGPVNIDGSVIHLNCGSAESASTNQIPNIDIG